MRTYYITLHIMTLTLKTLSISKSDTANTPLKLKQYHTSHKTMVTRNSKQIYILLNSSNIREVLYLYELDTLFFFTHRRKFLRSSQGKFANLKPFPSFQAEPYRFNTCTRQEKS